MTPKEKAIELVDKFLTTTIGYYEYYVGTNKEKAKQCALIAVDEIIEEVRDYSDTNHHQDRMNYWQQVRTEIENP